MARELSVSVEVLGTTEADAAIARLALAFQKAGDSATVAAEKADKFEKAYKDSTARKAAKAELDALTGSTGKFGSAASEATGKISAKQRALDGLTATVLKFAAPAVMGAAIKHTLDWAGNLNDLSKSTGISTTSLQKFEIIGKQSGVTMEQVANAAIQMSDRLAGGNKSAAQAVERVGLNLGQLMSMSPDQALLEVAHAAAQIHNPMERVAFLTDAVGKAGAKTLLPMIDDLNEKWKDTANVISEDGVKALDDAGDAFTDLGIAGNKFLADVLAPLAPAFTFVANHIADFVSGTIPKLQGWFSSVIDGFMQVEVAFRQFDDNMRNAGLAELDRTDPARATAVRQLNGLGAGGFFNAAQLAKDRLGAYRFQPTVTGTGTNGGMFGPAFFQPTVTTGGGAGGGVVTRGGKVLPFRGRTSFLGSAAASIFAMRNTRFNAGSLPFMSSPGLLESSGSPIDFMNGMQLMGGVPMNAPGATGGGLGGWLKNNKARVGIGLGTMAAGYLGSRIGGKAGGALSGAAQGAQMGMMFGPWGAAVGGVIGGVAGWIGAGKAAKNKKNAELSEVYNQFSTDQFIAMQKEADRLGISLEKALKAKTMKDFTAAVEEATGKIKEMTDLEDEIKRLTEATTVDFDKMNAVVQEFGLDVSKLGPAFQQAMSDKEAQRIIDAIAIMEKGGADMSGVLEGMADELSKVVQDSIKFGTTIPENMKPWIEELIKSGKLLDENGQVITDISKVKWGAAMESDMSKLTKKLDELVAKLKEMTEAFTQAAGAARDLGGVDYNQPNNPNPSNPNPSGNNESGMAVGGQAGRDFRRPGYGDVFPALLRRGETVLPPGVHRGGVAINGDIHVSGGYGSRADAVEQIGEAVVKYMERRGARLVA